MANVTAKTSSNIFYKARCEAATHNEQLSSREGAADYMSIDRGRLYRIESGIAIPYPEEIRLMADLYNAPELENYFCRTMCPLGCEMPKVELANLDRLTVRKTMVKKMVDMLEQENPGCFDMPDKTFIDLYMKSGLYITEIVKRLYQSDEMKKQFPDNKERLKHIFEKQVYGLAPTEIIYKIATSYILGFDEETKDIKHNFRQLDALPYAKDGTLEEVLEELYSEQ